MAEKKIFKSVNELYKIFGDGKYQVLCISVLCLAIVPIVIQQYIMIFLAIPPPWKMKNTSDIIRVRDTRYDDKCDISSDLWEWIEPEEYSIVIEFDLDCERENFVHLTIMLYFISSMIGSFFWGYISDRYGRKKALLVGTFLNITIALATAFAVDVNMFITLRSLNGFFTGSLLMSMVVYGTEIVSTEKRTISGMAPWISYSLGAFMLGAIAYGVKSWRSLLLYTSAPFYFICVFLWFLPESVAWEFNKNKVEKVKKKIQLVCKINGKEIPNINDMEIQKNENQQKPRFSNFLIIWKSKNMAVVTIILAFSWISFGIGYMGLAYSASNLTGNTHRDYLLLRFPENLSLIFAIYCSTRYGRKMACVIPMVLGGLFLIVVGVTPESSGKNEHKIIRIAFGVLGTFLIGISFQIIYPWTAEIYPTFFRSTASGFHHSCGYIGMMLAPWVALWLDRYHAGLPFYCMGGLLIIRSLLLLNINETMGQDLAEKVQNDDSKE